MYFRAGYKQINNKYNLKAVSVISIAALVAGTALVVMFWDSTSWDFIAYIPYKGFMTSLCLVPGIWYVFKRIIPCNRLRLLPMVGKYSLEVYSIHVIIAAAIRVLFIRIGMNNHVAGIILNVTVSTALPIIIAIVLKKLKIHSLIYKPFSLGDTLK